MQIVMPLALASLVACFALEARADVLVYNDTYSGWYRSAGTNNEDQGGGTSPGPLNYVVGRTDPSDTIRNYFVFDLSEVTGLETLAVAQLRIFSPVSSLPAFGSGYGSPDPSETYTLYGVSTDPSLLGIARGVFIFDDLGTGPVLGSVTVTLASSNGLPVVIDLNAAGLAAIQQSNGLFAFGGALTTLDPNRTTPEFIFGGTGGPNGAQLILSGSRVTVPEPAMLTFLSVALSGVVAVRRRTHGSPMHSRHRT